MTQKKPISDISLYDFFDTPLEPDAVGATLVTATNEIFAASEALSNLDNEITGRIKNYREGDFSRWNRETPCRNCGGEMLNVTPMIRMAQDIQERAGFLKMVWINLDLVLHPYKPIGEFESIYQCRACNAVERE